ncbi:hypothetical protein [Streptomyces inhibens]|uniref:hypothetical protein n=1 Tax=Streptomyces inhibens TaxID=2293571 RepID=UPI001EE6BA0C|nr:hypothetical protein [Streptomyces inhibens]UKY50992.1 hypothetical protein KI385_20660 [Streptomyces inhibens]
MTTEVRTDGRWAMDTFRELQLVLADPRLAFPEMSLSDTAEGDIRINLGRVGIRTAARLARALKAARS